MVIFHWRIIHQKKVLTIVPRCLSGAVAASYKTTMTAITDSTTQPGGGDALTLKGKTRHQLELEILDLREKISQAELTLSEVDDRMKKQKIQHNRLVLTMRVRLQRQNDITLSLRQERDQLMLAVTSRLLLIESELRREQKHIQNLLNQKDRLIEEQSKEILTLRKARTRKDNIDFIISPPCTKSESFAPSSNHFIFTSFSSGRDLPCIQEYDDHDELEYDRDSPLSLSPKEDSSSEDHLDTLNTKEREEQSDRDSGLGLSPEESENQVIDDSLSQDIFLKDIPEPFVPMNSGYKENKCNLDKIADLDTNSRTPLSSCSEVNRRDPKESKSHGISPDDCTDPEPEINPKILQLHGSFERLTDLGNRSDKVWLGCNRPFSNHRSVVKPRDVKYRRLPKPQRRPQLDSGSRIHHGILLSL